MKIIILKACINFVDVFYTFDRMWFSYYQPKINLQRCMFLKTDHQLPGSLHYLYLFILTSWLHDHAYVYRDHRACGGVPVVTVFMAYMLTESKT